MARQSRKIPTNKSYIVVCCGQTESLYLEEYKRKNRLHYKVKTIVKPVRPEQQLHYAEKIGMDADACYVLFDYDSFFTDEHKAKEIIERFEKKNGFFVVFSNECFDLWIWAHFEKVKKTSVNRKQISSKLDKLFGKDYQSLKADFKEMSKLVDRIDVAIENIQPIANNRYCNPSFDLTTFLSIISK